ncbi:Apolipoprotein A-I binding protein [Spraguea lophii 42_110]|uniref:NAD(P)H-hydrate epimerase n=1 Tax=Spraguea lophii (strain 42_110) TaxID=1358809 RepID=S7W9V1_SPRLO|nr:Apolipoprotein A-I binding protein [Spraguea lophii 42_110]
MKYISKKEAKKMDNDLLNMGFEITSLIELAGHAAFEVIQKIIDKNYNGDLKIIILVGPGNNGSDGLVIARYLKFVGHEVYVISEKINHLHLFTICKNLNIKMVTFDNMINIKPDYVIDALFGFSFRLPLMEPYVSIIKKYINEKIISIDVPTGYEIDNENITGEFIPIAVIAFGAPKLCSKKLKTYVVKSFFPQKCIANIQNYKEYEIIE